MGGARRGEGQTADERAGHGRHRHVAVETHEAEKVCAALQAEVLKEADETTREHAHVLETYAVDGLDEVLEVPFEERDDVGHRAVREIDDEAHVAQVGREHEDEKADGVAEHAQDEIE